MNVKTTLTIIDKRRYLDKLKTFSVSEFELKQKLISEDPSLFAYSLLRNRKGDRLKLYAFQDMIINDPNKLVAVAIARQTGKSTLAIIKALHYILNHDNATVLVISKTLKQSMELISKLKSLINNSPLKDALNELASGYDNKSEYYVKNKGKDTYSRIISVPATDAARGFTADLVIADEIAFWDNSVEMFNEAILPTISETKGSIIMLSTPKGKIGIFYQAFEKPKLWSCYQFDWRICPHHTEESMQVYKDQLGDFAFRQEYEASFVANQSAYFREKEVKDAIDDNLELGQTTALPVVIGVDFGKRLDNSVIYVGCIENPQDHYDYQRIKVIDVIEKPLGTDYNLIVGELKSLFIKYNPANILYDQTGVGEGPGDFMKDLGLPVEGIVFSIQKKVNLYSNLKLLFEKRQIKIPNLKRLKDELLLFEYEYTTSGNMKLHHPDGGHDDHCDSLCLMAFGLKRPGMVTPGLTIL